MVSNFFLLFSSLHFLLVGSLAICDFLSLAFQLYSILRSASPLPSLTFEIDYNERKKNNFHPIYVCTQILLLLECASDTIEHTFEMMSDSVKI